MKPLFLLADSRLLFPSAGSPSIVGRIRASLPDRGRVRAAYIGASNGDAPEYYDLFRAAFEPARFEEARRIPSEPTDEDTRYLREADVVLLAGGDPRRGWTVFGRNGWIDLARDKYAAGALLVGVSAGAMLLGLVGWSGDDAEPRDPFDALGLAPYIIDAHREPEWAALSRMLTRAPAGARGLGVPLGGGAIIHPDATIEPLAKPLTELWSDETGLRRALLVPSGGA